MLGVRDARSSYVESSAALNVDLQALTDALDQPDIDLRALLRHLADDARVAVPSFVGLSLTVVIDDYPVTLRVMNDVDPTTVAASARVPVGAFSDAVSEGTLVFYASNAGALVDFAADVSYALRLDLPAVVLDADLPGAFEFIGLSGATELSQINQAIGILIEHGNHPEAAHDELRHLARFARRPVLDTAVLLIAATRQASAEPA